MSATAARKFYGFEKMTERSAAVEQCISDAQHIREAVDDLVNTQDKALLATYGVVDPSSDSDSESESGGEVNDISTQTGVNLCASDTATLISLLAKAHFNWFEFQERAELFLEQENPEILITFANKITV